MTSKAKASEEVTWAAPGLNSGIFPGVERGARSPKEMAQDPVDPRGPGVSWEEEVELAAV